MTYDELITKIGQLSEQAKEVVTRNANSDEWPSEDKVKFDGLHVEMRKLGETKKRLDDQKKIEDDLNQTHRQVEPDEIRRAPAPATAAAFQRKATNEECDWALRAWLLGQHGGDALAAIKPEWRAAAQKLGVNINERSFPFKMSPYQPRSTKSDEMNKWEQRALTLTTTAGGYLVSPEMNRALEETRLYFGPMLQVAYTLRTDSGAAISIPTFNGTATKGRILGVNTQITQTDPAFGSVSLGAYKYSSDGVLVPVELIQDSGVPIGDFLGRILGERIGRIVNEHTTTGTGTTQPTGVVVGAGAVNLGTGTAAGFGSFTTGAGVVNLLKILHGVDLAYRNGGDSVGWMMNDATLQTLAGAVDSTGRPIWMPSLVAGEPDRLLGYRIFINNDMTATPANNARTVLFGDFSKYWIRETRDISVVRDDSRFVDFHQTLFLAFARYDGALINSAAVKAGVHQT